MNENITLDNLDKDTKDSIDDISKRLIKELINQDCPTEQLSTNVNDKDVLIFLISVALEEIDNGKYESDEEMLDDYIGR